MASAILFEDTFEVKNKDPDGKKFDKVSRLVATGQGFEMELILDINTEIYPVDIDEKYTLLLASTLSLEGAPDPEMFDQSNQQSLMDDYEYVMYGKVYQISEDKQSKAKISVYVSFGGLLMKLTGERRNLDCIENDSRLYLLMRQV